MSAGEILDDNSAARGDEARATDQRPGGAGVGNVLPPVSDAARVPSGLSREDRSAALADLSARHRASLQDSRPGADPLVATGGADGRVAAEAARLQEAGDLSGLARLYLSGPGGYRALRQQLSLGLVEVLLREQQVGMSAATGDVAARQSRKHFTQLAELVIGLLSELEEKRG